VNARLPREGVLYEVGGDRVELDQLKVELHKHECDCRGTFDHRCPQHSAYMQQHRGAA